MTLRRIFLVLLTYSLQLFPSVFATELLDKEYNDNSLLIQSVFDADYYRSIHKNEIDISGLSEFDHFMSIGWQNDFNPNNWFDLKKYRTYYPCQGNPLLDWLNQSCGVTNEKYDEDVIISITSHPPRINTTWLSIESLLRQQKKPNKVILNLAVQDFPDRQIPQSLEILKKRGIDIRFSEINYRVATKLLPTLKDFPEAIIITADDDRRYAEDWLEILLEQHLKYPNKIVCPHVRKYVYDGSWSGYPRIDYLKQDIVYDTPIFGIFEGFSGVLYPPHAFDQEIFNFDTFKQLTPCADDVWYQAMAIKNGTQTISLQEETAKRIFWPLEIDGTQESGLFHEHLCANDVMAYRTLYYYNLLDKVGIPEVNKMRCQGCRRDIPLIKSGMAFSTQEVTKGNKCKFCFNTSKKKVLCVGAYDHGNIGDNIYKKIFQHYFGDDFDLKCVVDTRRMNRNGKYIYLDSPEEDFEFDALIIGGGGIIKNFSKTDPIRYYMERAIEKDKPFFIVSVGMQTSEQDLSLEEAKKRVGQSLELFKKASLLFPRSVQDYFVLRSLLGDDMRHKIYVKPDLGYLYPEVALKNRTLEKKYISLIQTGSANVEMEDVRNIINEKLKEYPGSELVIMNWGGVEKPGTAKDFKEWDLFAINAKRHFPQATVYMGDSLSTELMDLICPAGSTLKIRKSDLTPEKAVEIVAQSHYVVTGRYHGVILARAMGIPYHAAIYSFKCNAENSSGLDPLRALDTIESLKHFITNNMASLESPLEWDADQRNCMIDRVHQIHPTMSVKYIQAMDNISIYKILALGKI